MKKQPLAMLPETLRNLNAELRKARRDHPDRARNLEVLQHFVAKMPLVLTAHSAGARDCKAIDVYANALCIAVMAIRIAEEGASNFEYANYVSQSGPLFQELENDLPERDA